MSDALRALAQATSDQHSRMFTFHGDECPICTGAEWPCLPRRLADATLQHLDENKDKHDYS